jgi:hypothetical protein
MCCVGVCACYLSVRGVPGCVWILFSILGAYMGVCALYVCVVYACRVFVYVHGICVCVSFRIFFRKLDSASGDIAKRLSAILGPATLVRRRTAVGCWH